MRLSRSRLVLRIALLTLLGGYLLVRGCQGRGEARHLALPEAFLGSRLALVATLLGAVALLTAALAALALLRRPRTRRPLFEEEPGAKEGHGEGGAPP